MAKGISYGGKIHKNRDKEFFNSIAGKYRVSENSLSLLPKLIYRETAHMISYIAGNRFFVNEKLNLKNYSIKKQEYNNYFNYTTKKISINNYDTSNYRINNRNISVKSNVRSSYSGQENDSSYKAKLISITENTSRNQSFERNINGVDGYGIGILTGSSYASGIGVLYFPHLNNIMRWFFAESNGSMGIEGLGTMFSPKTVLRIASKLSVISNTGLMTQKSNTMTADYGSLARETKAKNGNTNRNLEKETLSIDDRNFYGLGSENNMNNYSSDYRRSGIKASTGSTYRQSLELELAVNETARKKTEKSEAPSQNVVSEGTKETNKQNPLDINKIVSQVYNEFERRFRIERERRGL